MLRTSTLASIAVALGLVFVGTAPASAQTRRPRPEGPRSDAPERADVVEELLRRALDRARDGGREELADRLEEQLDLLLERRDDLRRRLRPDREEPETDRDQPRRERRRRVRPRLRRRETRSGETEVFLGLNLKSGRYEVGYAPESGTVRITTFSERGNRRELTYEMGKGIGGLRDLWEDLKRLRGEENDKKKKDKKAPSPRRRRRRRGSRAASPI